MTVICLASSGLCELIWGFRSGNNRFFDSLPLTLFTQTLLLHREYRNVMPPSADPAKLPKLPGRSADVMRPAEAKEIPIAARLRGRLAIGRDE